MNHPRKHLSAGLLLMASLLLATPSGAGQMPDGDRERPASGGLDFGPPVSGEILDSLSGGQSFTIDTIDLLMNNMDLKADMQGNLLNSATTGINRISDEAFTHASGISTVVQNSGNQVIINNALILNLQMQ